MKLVLSNNQSPKFTEFHKQLQASQEIYEYVGYKDLVFVIKTGEINFINLKNNKQAENYEAVYLTSYINCLEYALAAATVLDFRGIRYADSQLKHGVSMSKLTEYTKLAATKVPIPSAFAGSARALLKGLDSGVILVEYPIIVKRADSDRGIDNFKVADRNRLVQILGESSSKSPWIIQEFIPNNGFYRLSFYLDSLASVIFRSAHPREDGNEEKSHLNKPKGGANAKLIEPEDLPAELLGIARGACRVMGRDFGGVDMVIDSTTGRPYILEVNYNPQLVTVSAHKDTRSEAFLNAMRNL